MPQKTIHMDVPGRNLIMKGLGTERIGHEKRQFWRFVLDERKYRRNKTAKFYIFPLADQEIEQISRSLKKYLHNFVSSSWLDENWFAKVEPQIVAFISRVRQEMRDNDEAVTATRGEKG